MGKSSGYLLTEYIKAVIPTKSRFKTKSLALKEMSNCVKEARITYAKSGFKKVGTLKSGRITFEHPAFGIDWLVYIEKV